MCNLLQVTGSGQLMLINENLSRIFQVYAWFTTNENCLLQSFKTTISTDAQLLDRAHDDISSGFDVDPDEVTPTHLIIYEFDDARYTDTVPEV